MSGEHANHRARQYAASWGEATDHALNSYAEANRALLAGFGLTNSTTNGTGVRGPKSTTQNADDRLVPATPELAHAMAGWSFERSVDTREALGVGEFVRFAKPLREADVEGFADASGDTNRLHLDDEFAADTRFGGRIVHGTLVAGLISAALARLPGLTIYLSQDLEFRGPVRIGSTVRAECEIVEDLGEDTYRLHTEVTVEDEATADGETGGRDTAHSNTAHSDTDDDTTDDDATGETVIDGEAVVLIDEFPGA